MKRFVRTLLALSVLVLLAIGLLFPRDEDVASAGIVPVARPERALELESGELAAVSRAMPATATPEELDVTRARAEIAPVAPVLGYRIEGRVVDARGIGVRAASVRCWRDEQARAAAAATLPEPTVASDGSFVLELETAGEYRLWAHAAEHLSSDVLAVDLTHREPNATVELVLPAGLAITGVVLDSLHEPVADATVQAFVDIARFGGELPDGVDSVEYYGRPTATSRDDGAFWLYPVRRVDVGYVLQAWSQRDLVRSAAPIPSGPDQKLVEVFSFTISSGDRMRVDRPFGLPRLAVLPSVAAGAQGVELVLQEDPPGRSSVRLVLTTEDDGELPRDLVYELRHVGPRGALLSSWGAMLELDEQGVTRIPGLFIGARYELSIRHPELSWERELEAFRAYSGEMSLGLEIPGLFPVTLELRDPRGRLTEGDDLNVAFRVKGGQPRPIVRSYPLHSSEPLVLSFPAGRYEVRVYNGFSSLLEREIEVHAGTARVILEVP